jgi:hypothetical protein
MVLAAARTLAPQFASTLLPGGEQAATFLFAVLGEVRAARVGACLKGVARRLSRSASEFDDLASAPDDGPIRLGLFEGGVRSAEKAVTEDRLDRIAAIVARGLTASGARVEGYQRLLKVLDDLNDVEVIILTSAGHTKPDRDRFWRHHRASLEYALPTWFSAPEAIAHAALYRSYYSHLERTGLLTEQRELTDFGRYFLRASDVLGQSSVEIDQTYETEQRRAAPEFVPAYLASLTPELLRALKSISKRLLLPEEPQVTTAPALSFSGRLVTNSLEPLRLEGFAHPHDRYIWCQYVWKATAPRPLTPQGGELGAQRRLDLRHDTEGTYALVGLDRVYSLANAAEYLCEPLALFLSIRHSGHGLS